MPSFPSLLYSKIPPFRLCFILLPVALQILFAEAVTVRIGTSPYNSDLDITSIRLHKQQVLKRLPASLSYINITTDLWTSGSGLALLGAITHFANHQGDLE
jgi:hypothetical protein